MVEWRSISWLPRYEVSEDGQVRRFFKNGSVRVLAGEFGRKNYRRFCVVCADGKKRYVYAHRLVCEAWHGPAPTPQHQAAHFDGDNQNNHHSNLRWATVTENYHDRFRHGTWGHKVGWVTAASIREEFNGRRGQVAELARKHGVSSSTVSEIINGNRWVEPPAASNSPPLMTEPN